MTPSNHRPSLPLSPRGQKEIRSTTRRVSFVKYLCLVGMSVILFLRKPPIPTTVYLPEESTVILWSKNNQSHFLAELPMAPVMNTTDSSFTEPVNEMAIGGSRQHPQPPILLQYWNDHKNLLEPDGSDTKQRCHVSILNTHK
jgi:hypothetical protein